MNAYTKSPVTSCGVVVQVARPYQPGEHSVGFEPKTAL